MTNHVCRVRNSYIVSPPPDEHIPGGQRQVSLTSGSHIWFGSVEFISTKEGDDLDLVPPTNKPANFSEHVDDL
jgi:hypothetical protein